jgi:hypothetical protein
LPADEWRAYKEELAVGPDTAREGARALAERLEQLTMSACTTR